MPNAVMPRMPGTEFPAFVGFAHRGTDARQFFEDWHE